MNLKNKEIVEDLSDLKMGFYHLHLNQEINFEEVLRKITQLGIKLEKSGFPIIADAINLILGTLNNFSEFSHWQEKTKSLFVIFETISLKIEEDLDEFNHGLLSELKL